MDENKKANLEEKKNDDKKNSIFLIPLGGLGEIGKNMMCIRYKGEILIIDCGIKFPDDDMFGIDLVIPDMSYVINNQDKITGIFLTHGHEDHIGAIPYLFSELDKSPPIYGGGLTIQLVKSKLEEHNIKLKHVEFNVIKTREPIQSGHFKIEYLSVTHSIADSYAIVINTDVGTILHTGDFKIDHNPIDGKPFDFYRFASLGENGLLALLSDSTNVEREGFSVPESELEKKFKDAIINNKGRTIIATFSTNIHRIQQVIDVAVELGKKVALSGRSMERIVNLSLQSGYLRIPMGVMIGINQINEYPRNKVIVVSTGSQGEPMSALYLLATESHRWFELSSEDTVIISASVIPGNEKTVSKVVNTLFKTGATIIYKDFGNVHVSGHAYKEDLKLMISITKPKFFMPVHGEFRHLVHHATLAEEMGIKGNNIMIGKDGDIIEINQNEMKKIDHLGIQRVFVDGKGVGDIGNRVLKDREALSQDGVVMVIVAIKGLKIHGKPEVISRGFIYVKENIDMIDEAKSLVEKVVKDSLSKEYGDVNTDGRIDFPSLKTRIKNKLKSFFYSEVERKPMIMIRIIEF